MPSSRPEISSQAIGPWSSWSRCPVSPTGITWLMRRRSVTQATGRLPCRHSTRVGPAAPGHAGLRGSFNGTLTRGALRSTRPALRLSAPDSARRSKRRETRLCVPHSPRVRLCRPP